MNIFIEQYKLFNDNNLMIDYILNQKIMVYDKINDPNDLLDCLDNNCENYELEFILDENNYRIPYYNNNKIIAIKINPESICCL